MDVSLAQTLRLLLPRARAWRAAPGSVLRAYIDGVGLALDDVRVYLDGVYQDRFPATTRELEEWEQQFGLLGSGSDQDRRSAIAAAWQATGGQSPGYIQGVLQAAGFDVYVHDWWSSGPPYVARDPRSYTTPPTFGTAQCGEPLAQCGEPEAQCNTSLANEPGYLVNLDLTYRAPPAVPDDPDAWRGFMYIGGPTFGDVAEVPLERRHEFERLVLKLRPLHLWVVTLVSYSLPEPLTIQGGDQLVTQGGQDREFAVLISHDSATRRVVTVDAMSIALQKMRPLAQR